jgi:hypothetical protein
VVNVPALSQTTRFIFPGELATKERKGGKKFDMVAVGPAVDGLADPRRGLPKGIFARSLKRGVEGGMGMFRYDVV